MTPQEFLLTAKTGTPLFVAGKSLESEAIEFLEGGTISHAATFFWMDTEAWVAEMNERDGAGGDILNAGFQVVPFSQWLTQQTGPIYFGTAPQVVYDHPEKVLALIQWYQANPIDQHYGFGSLLPIFLNHWLGKIDKDINIPIPKWGEVCDTFSIACEDNAGATLPTDETPDDLANKSKPLTLIQTA